MEFTVYYKYTKDWIPPRCRKPRPGLFEGSMTARIAETSEKDAPVAAIVWDHGHNPVTKDFELHPIDVRWHGGRFWVEAAPVNENFSYMPNCYTIQDVVSRVSHEGYAYRSSHSVGDVEQEIRDFCDEWLIIDGSPWHFVGEPRYVVQTFGLGHNHGGTSWFVDTMYNGNIAKEAYFNANDFEGMVEHYFDVALGRGDTRDAHRHATELAEGTGYEYIDVKIPDAFTCNPGMEHGDGDPFMNELYKMTSGTGSAFESGLLVMATVAKELRDA